MISHRPNVIVLLLQAEFMKQFCQGLSYLHTLTVPVIHGDVKLANALVDTGLTIKVINSIIHFYHNNKLSQSIMLLVFCFMRVNVY